LIKRFFIPQLQTKISRLKSVQDTHFNLTVDEDHYFGSCEVNRTAPPSASKRMKKRQAAVAVAAPVVVDDEDYENDDEDYENIAQSVLNVKKNQKKNNSGNGSAKSSSKNGRTIEEMYQKKSQLEHILLRPDTYGQ
jgi:hypothetical protein